MAENSLAGGFAAPAVNSAVAFRGIMMAMAEPGRIMPVSGGTPPRPMEEHTSELQSLEGISYAVFCLKKKKKKKQMNINKHALTATSRPYYSTTLQKNMLHTTLTR